MKMKLLESTLGDHFGVGEPPSCWFNPGSRPAVNVTLIRSRLDHFPGCVAFRFEVLVHGEPLDGAGSPGLGDSLQRRFVSIRIHGILAGLSPLSLVLSFDAGLGHSVLSPRSVKIFSYSSVLKKDALTRNHSTGNNLATSRILFTETNESFSFNCN